MADLRQTCVYRSIPATIERVLTGMRWDRASRSAFLGRLRTRRVRSQPLRSYRELRALASAVGMSAADACLDDHFTIHSGRVEPDPAFISAPLARLLARPPVAGRAPAGPGAALAIEASLPQGRATRAIVRLGGRLDAPVTVFGWEPSSRCPAGGRPAAAPVSAIGYSS